MIASCPLPKGALLRRYAAQQGCYTDCFETALPDRVALSDFLRAFYGSGLFALEKQVLRLSLRGLAINWDAGALAEGREDRFAAWKVEERAPGQILLSDLAGHTRSYLAVTPKGAAGTQLLFGSAVVPRAGRGLHWMVRASTPLHRLYSRALLAQAARGLGRES
jgi:hypothetical protein